MGLAASLLVILVSGCACRSAGAAPSDIRALVGTWYGAIGQPGGSLYTVEAQAILEIKADGTFTTTVIPLPAANNLARASTWSGHAVGNVTRVTFRTAQGPSLKLVRSRGHLYGVANDPTTAMVVMIDFDRAAGR